jgi:hypothetical protein
VNLAGGCGTGDEFGDEASDLDLDGCERFPEFAVVGFGAVDALGVGLAEAGDVDGGDGVAGGDDLAAAGAVAGVDAGGGVGDADFEVAAGEGVDFDADPGGGAAGEGEGDGDGELVGLLGEEGGAVGVEEDADVAAFKAAVEGDVLARRDGAGLGAGGIGNREDPGGGAALRGALWGDDGNEDRDADAAGVAFDGDLAFEAEDGGGGLGEAIAADGGFQASRGEAAWGKDGEPFGRRADRVVGADLGVKPGEVEELGEDVAAGFDEVDEGGGVGAEGAGPADGEQDGDDGDLIGAAAEADLAAVVAGAEELGADVDVDLGRSGAGGAGEADPGDRGGGVPVGGEAGTGEGKGLGWRDAGALAPVEEEGGPVGDEGARGRGGGGGGNEQGDVDDGGGFEAVGIGGEDDDGALVGAGGELGGVGDDVEAGGGDAGGGGGGEPVDGGVELNFEVAAEAVDVDGKEGGGGEGGYGRGDGIGIDADDGVPLGGGGRGEVEGDGDVDVGAAAGEGEEAGVGTGGQAGGEDAGLNIGGGGAGELGEVEPVGGTGRGPGDGAAGVLDAEVLGGGRGPPTCASKEREAGEAEKPETGLGASTVRLTAMVLGLPTATTEFLEAEIRMVPE